MLLQHFQNSLFASLVFSLLPHLSFRTLLVSPFLFLQPYIRFTERVWLEFRDFSPSVIGLKNEGALVCVRYTVS